MSLSEQEQAVITKSWTLIKKDLKQNGVELFTIIFTAKPEYMDYFPQFKGLTMEEVRTSSKMRAHASIFMHSMSSIVENLDDIECAAEIMRKKVQSHFNRGMRKSHYDALFIVVWPIFLKQVLGDSYEETMTAPWAKVSEALLAVISAELDRLEKEQTGEQ